MSDEQLPKAALARWRSLMTLQRPVPMQQASRV